jgi:thioredoxin reductase
MLTNRKETLSCEVAVIGGGAAGLSAGQVLGRARRSVVVIDAGQPRNAPAEAVHGFLTRDGIAPAELARLGQEEVRRYGGRIVAGEAVAAARTGDGFTVTLADGRQVDARRLVIATGVVDELPDVPGLAQRWGRDVIHCPYCHGWEHRDQPIGVLGSSDFTVHQAMMFRQWTDDLVVFTHTGAAPTEAEAEELAARGIVVVDGLVAGLEVTDDRLTGVRMADGTVVPRRALTVVSPAAPRSALLDSLGLRAVPGLTGAQIAVDPNGLTEVAGVWVAGNVADPRSQVIAAAAQGVLVAAAVNGDLTAEDTRRAVESHRRVQTPV